MDTRFHPRKTTPALVEPFLTLRERLMGSALDPALIHLVDLRASQINGCHYCIRLHTDEARHEGERVERLDQLATWTTSDAFRPDERAALAWTEALTRGSPSTVIDRLHRDLQAHFNDEQISALTVAVAAINAWNRIGVACYREATDPALAA